MGLFENFPYTNFHNLNLDWIIKVLKNAVSELEEIQTNWESVRDTANTAKTTADAAAVKAENARTTANGAMTKADSAETKAKNADANADLAVVQSSAAQDTATSAEAAANEAKETAARAENTAGTAQATANAAKTTADGVDGKATTALTNSQNAVTTANAAKTTAEGLDAQVKAAQSAADAAYDIAEEADKTATSADSKVDALTTTVNSVGKTANDAMSLAQTNEKDIASNDADIAEIRKFITAPVEVTMEPGGYCTIAAGNVNYNIPDGTLSSAYTQVISATISDGARHTLNEFEAATDGDGHKLYRVDYIARVWLNVGETLTYIPAVVIRSAPTTLLIAATSIIPYAATDGGLHYTVAAVCNLVGINQYTSTPT